MSMLDNIEKLMTNVGASINYRTINLGGKFLYVEGIKNVVAFSTTQMEFQLKNCLLIVDGSGLKLNYLDKTTCVIEGEIKSVLTK